MIAVLNEMPQRKPINHRIAKGGRQGYACVLTGTRHAPFIDGSPCTKQPPDVTRLAGTRSERGGWQHSRGGRWAKPKPAVSYCCPPALASDALHSQTAFYSANMNKTRIYNHCVSLPFFNKQNGRTQWQPQCMQRLISFAQQSQMTGD